MTNDDKLTVEKRNEGSRVRPLPNPNREEIRTIMYGSEVVVVNYQGDAPGIMSGPWDERIAEHALSELDDENDRFDGSILLVLDPVIETAHSDRVLSVDEVIEDVVSEVFSFYEDDAADLIAESDQTHAEALIESAMDNGEPTAKKMVALLRAVVAKAREGLVENPF